MLFLKKQVVNFERTTQNRVTWAICFHSMFYHIENYLIYVHSSYASDLTGSSSYLCINMATTHDTQGGGGALKFLDDSLLLDLDHYIMSTIQSDPVINDEKRSLYCLDKHINCFTHYMHYSWRLLTTICKVMKCCVIRIYSLMRRQQKKLLSSHDLCTRLSRSRHTRDM